AGAPHRAHPAHGLGDARGAHRDGRDGDRQHPRLHRRPPAAAPRAARNTRPRGGAMTDFLMSGPAAAKATLLFAHGAGAAMDSPWMAAFAEALGAAGVRVARFEFPYMAGRRSGTRRPPPRAESL